MAIFMICMADYDSRASSYNAILQSGTSDATLVPILSPCAVETDIDSANFDYEPNTCPPEDYWFIVDPLVLIW